MIFERLKKLYEEGKITNLNIYVAKGLITPDQANEILRFTKGNIPE